MKKILLAAALVACGSASAHAADAVVEQAAEVYNWSGFYIGGAVGGQSLRGDDRSYGDGSSSDTGFAGAVYGGYNYQYANWVFGLEGDVKFSNAKVYDDDYLDPLKSRVGGSVRGRVGYAVENFLPYLTGGLAIASFRDDHNGGGFDLATETLTGYSVGGGLEWGVTQNLIFRGEYLFSDFGKNDFHFNGSDVHEIDVQTHDFRLGLAYKF